MGVLNVFRDKMQQHPALAITYKIFITVIAIAIMATGVAMLVLPGPGILVILAGLGLLGTEFPWAHRLVQRIKVLFFHYRDKVIAWWRERKARKAT